MDNIDTIKAFLSATHLHSLEGDLAGMKRAEVAMLMLSYSVGLYLETLGRDATIEALRRQASTLEGSDG